MKSSLRNLALKSFIFLIALITCTHQATATTVVPITDDEMLIGARAIVIARVLSVASSLDESQDRIYTYTTLKVQEVLKGQISQRKIVIKEEGGDLGYRGSIVYGTPRYKPGERVLLYLNTWLDGSLRTHQMFLGKFNIVTDPDTGRKIVARSVPDSDVVYLKGEAQSQASGGVVTERMELGAYKAMIRNRMAANSERIQEYEDKYYRSAPMFSRPPEYDGKVKSGGVQPQYTFIVNPPVRWFEPDSGQPVIFTVNPDGAPSGGISDLDAVMNTWSTVPGCSLRVQRNPQSTGACVPGGGLNTIIFNGCDGRWGAGPSCSGILALGGLGWTFETTVVNGTTFRRARDGFVSFNPWCPNSPCGVQGDVTTQLVATHELGHALGLGHSWQPSHGGSPTAEQLNATMYYLAQFNRCAALATDDINGIVFMYPGAGGGGALTVTTSSLAGGTVGAAYSQTLAASGGTTPYTWSLAAGSGPLPNGLTLSSNGTISGTPSTANTFNFTVQVTDSASATAQKALSITISNPGTAYNSEFVSQTVTSSVSPSQQFNGILSWRNTGTQTWNGSAGFVIRSQNPAGNTTWGGNQVNLTGFSWAPGQTMTVQITFIAPSTPGIYNFQWQCYQNGVGYFGQMSTNITIQVGDGGSGCSYSLNQTTRSMAASSSTGSVNVTAGTGCAWTAQSNDSWITITAGASGSGNNTVSYSVAANSAATNRTGTITVAGLTYTIYQGANFLDVPPSHPFYMEIGKLSARGVTTGCGNGNYCPDAPVTRQQMAAFIMRALGEFNPPTPGSQQFLDVPPSNPFYAFIGRMAELQITSGCGGGNYCPTGTVTRGQMAVFLVRAFGL